MSYFYLNSDLHSSPETAEVGPEAIGLYVMAFAYCSRNGLGPVLPKDALADVVGKVRGPASPLDLTQKLIAVGLWTDEGDHYRMNEKYCRLRKHRGRATS